jgi:hypothetical protein
VEDESLRDYGTLLCRPKDGRLTAGRPWVANTTGRLLDGAARMLRLRRNWVYRGLMRSSFGLWSGLGPCRQWLPWRLFEIAKVVPALPNHFMAFAPSSRSYHAVRMNIPAENKRQGRRVIRGFIRKGRNARNWIETERPW